MNTETPQVRIEDLTNELIAAIWPALDEGISRDEIRAAIDNVFDAWEPKEPEALASVTYLIFPTVDETPVGSTWGDALKDAKTVAKRRLKKGDVWAWANVEVCARVTINGSLYGGSAHLGGCCYEDEADFIENSDAYTDLCEGAVQDLVRRLKRETTNAGAIMTWLEANGLA